MAKTKAAPQAQDPLDQLVDGDPKDVLALILWKNRHNNPELSVQITAKDIEGFQACCEYLEVEPEVRIIRPAGRPAQEAMVKNGQVIAPARPADPPKPFVVAQIVAKGTDNAIRPVENNLEDYDRQQQMAAVRKARDQASMHAANILTAVKTGEWSLSDMQEAANALTIMAAALK